MYGTLYAGVDYNLSLCRLQSRLQNIYYGQPYARVDFIAQSGAMNLFSASFILREQWRNFWSFCACVFNLMPCDLRLTALYAVSFSCVYHNKDGRMLLVRTKLHFELFRFWLLIRGDIHSRKTSPRLAESGSQEDCL